jgi:FkbM family methyltransferase
MNYEPKAGYYGQFSTDVLIELYFNGQADGVCVEVGAANGFRGSNTLYFEKMGWRTLCIEPNPEYYDMVNSTRKESIQCACGPENASDIPFTIYDIGQRNIMSSVSGLRPDERLVKEHEDKNLINRSYQILVDVRTLDSVLTEAKFEKDIDFISIDTEGTELDVLHGLDLTHWNIKLLVVENNYNDKNIEEYLNKFGYIKDTRWKINDFYIKGDNR